MVKLFRMYSNLCDHNPPTLQTDGQTDTGQTICDGNTALCTKVHRAVKKQAEEHKSTCSSVCKSFDDAALTTSEKCHETTEENIMVFAPADDMNIRTS